MRGKVLAAVLPVESGTLRTCGRAGSAAIGAAALAG
jgi:hypothetical protein